MRRRRLLALCGSLLAGAGCSGGPVGRDTVTPVPSPETPTRTDTPDGRFTDTTVRVRSATVQPGIVGPGSPDSIAVYDDAGQYLVFDITVESGDAPPRGAFRLRFDGSEYLPQDSLRGFYREDSWAAQYEGGSGPVAFPLPETGDASDAALVWPGGERALSERVRERLTAPLPSFDVSFSAPATVAEGEPVPLKLTVENTGDRAGRYVVALNRSGPRIAYTPVRRVTGVLDAGESVTHEYEGRSPYVADPPREARYHLDAPGDADDGSWTVAPAESGTATQTPTPTPGERTETATPTRTPRETDR